MDANTSGPEATTDDTTTAKVRVTVFRDVFATIKFTADRTLHEIRQRVLTKSGLSKHDLPLLKLAIFGDQPNDEDCLRYDQNVQKITGIELDYDDEKISFDDALSALRKLRISALLYTSPSHKPDAPHWRILAPTSRPRHTGLRTKLLARLNGYLKQKLGAETVAGGESFTLSQAYFYGFVRGAPDHKAEVIEGTFIDERDDDLAMYEAQGAKTDDDDKKKKDKKKKTDGDASQQDKAKPIPNNLASLLYLQGSGPYPSRSELLFAFITGALKAGVGKTVIINACINTTYIGCGIYEHVKENRGKPYVERQIEQAREKVAEIRAEQQLTELGNARLLVKRYGEDLRFVHVWNSWVIWKDGHWRRDDDAAIMRLAKANADEMLREAVGINDEIKRTNLLRHAMQSQKAAQLRNMVALAESEAAVVLSADSWDADPYMLGVQNGVVDLRTGAFREAIREDYITKLAGTSYDPDAKCPNWDAFLLRIFSDKELIAYVQRACGYMATGLTVEEIMFELWGTGNNGKTTFRETLFSLFGDYAASVDASLLVTQLKKGGSATPDVARLFGRRLITINETAENDHLNESRVKFITGHDTITARNLYEGLFDFKPTHKTVLTTNHRLIVRGTDDGIWRRIDFWPFVVKIPDAEKNRHFREQKLLPELPGILNWLLEGSKAYLRDGLRPPSSVRNATNEYRKDMDLVGRWIDERCELDGNAEAITRELYLDYSYWAEDEIGFKLRAIAFGRNLADRGFEPAKVQQQRGFRGLKIRKKTSSF
jgi:putative DNA primase/helicase